MTSHDNSPHCLLFSARLKTKRRTSISFRFLLFVVVRGDSFRETRGQRRPRKRERIRFESSCIISKDTEVFGMSDVAKGSAISGGHQN
jgi:hypothetical protein